MSTDAPETERALIVAANIAKLPGLLEERKEEQGQGRPRQGPIVDH